MILYYTRRTQTAVIRLKVIIYRGLDILSYTLKKKRIDKTLIPITLHLLNITIYDHYSFTRI